jgi:hypothetical protein
MDGWCLAQVEAVQKVLQFQSLGTLAATSTPLAGPVTPGTAGEVAIGLVGSMLWFPSHDALLLDAWLLFRLFHAWNWEKQCPHEREGVPLGL